MRIYRRRLPHWDAPGCAVFVTWSLWECVPRERAFSREQLSSGEVFVAWDRLLDNARTGARYLAMEPVARIVMDKLFAADADLDSFVIMPNHVHVLWRPSISVATLMRGVKGASAMEANRILARTGQKFWQEEYFDR